MYSPSFGEEEYFIASVAFSFLKMLFRVLGSLGFIILQKPPLKFAVYPLIHVYVSRKELYGRSAVTLWLIANPVLAGNLETFSSHIQGPYDPLEFSISVVLSYFHTYLN